ncbi:GPR1-like protein [Mya arenaria]|uniref:GPR1-like protein n=1 Tax=Mya arenaria TaxID=6604 RepID=A0ABY7FDP6_MYAAR|nr:GPR1-like protein [Mya arenaria]
MSTDMNWETPALAHFEALNETLKNKSNDIDESAVIESVNLQQFQLQLPAIIYTIMLMVIGTPGNIIVLYVYFFKWRKSTSRMFILFLTSLDLVNCVTTLPMEIFIMRYSVMLDIPWLCKISRFSTYTMNSSSALILVAIAVDRYRRICRPHGPQFSAKASKYISICCIVFALSLTWPSLLFYGTRSVKLGNVEGKSCLLENKFDESVYPHVYFVAMMAITVVIFTTLSVFYYFVGIQVYRHRKMRLTRKREQIANQTLTQTR